MKTPPIITIGELLVDWFCQDTELQDNKIHDFKMAAGGAPANVAIGLAKLGYPVNFMGGISDDLFGAWLFEYLKSSGVNTELVKQIPQSTTRHAYIFTDESGNRVLKSITANHCPDSLYSSSMLESECLAQASMFYFGSVIQSSIEGAKNLEGILQLIPSSVLTVYDPNIRTCLWTNQEKRLKACLEQSAKNVDILKLSDNELSFFTTETDVHIASRTIFDRYQPTLLVVTLGEKGALYISPKGEDFITGFKVPSVEMTGAGDGFVTGLLGGIYALAQQKCQSAKETALSLTPAEIESILSEASAVGALATTQPGATAGLPNQQQLKAFLLQHSTEALFA